MTPDQSPPVVLFVGTAAYTHFARFLAESIHRFHPDWPVYFCRVDPGPQPSPMDHFQILEPDWLEGKTGALTRFQYIPVELCGMSRPRAMLKLFGMGISRILYFDLDISVHAPLAPFTDALKKSAIVLTPHLLTPSTGERPEEAEKSYRLNGLINSGCMALREAPQSRDFLKWWAARTERHGHLDMASGYFNEQSWVDYALSFYEETTLLRHPGINVAWWNITERPLAIARDGSFTAGAHPLVCFHWSGYRTHSPGQLTSYKSSSAIPPDSPLHALAEDYHSSLLSHGASSSPQNVYPYSQLSDGTPIKPVWMEAVRQRHPDLEYPDDPFQASHQWIGQLQSLEKKMQFSRKDWILKHAKKQRNNALKKSLWYRLAGSFQRSG